MKKCAVTFKPEQLAEQVISCYARHTRCPVLTQRLHLPGTDMQLPGTDRAYAAEKRCPLAVVDGLY